MNDIEDNNSCPICGKSSKSYKLWVHTDGWDIVQCNLCGMGFLKYEEKDLDNLNAIIYNSNSYYKLIKRMQYELTIRYKKQLKEICRFSKEKGRIIDIGCSLGLFLNIAGSFGFEPYGIDINKINLNKAKRMFDINVLPDNFLENEKFNNFFDVATMWDVLEHLPDPIEFLSRLSLKIKRGGLLVVQCPNMESYEFLKFGDSWNWLSPGDHLQFFTPKTLIRVLSKSGFHPIKVKTWIDGLTFSKSMISLYNKDPTLKLNRLLFKAVFKMKNLFQKHNLNIPIEKVQGLFGWVLQMVQHARRQHSLIKVYALKL